MLSLALFLVLPFTQAGTQAGTPLPLEVARLKAPDGAADVDFGFSVDLDGEWLAVSAPGSDLAGLDSGAIHVFRRDEGGPGAWGAAQTLLPGPGGDFAGARLGGTTMAVNDNGSIRIFELEDGQWNPTALVSPPPGSSWFAKAFDVDGDTLAVGAGYWDCYNWGGTVESVYVHERDADGPGAWGQVAYFVNGYQGGGFGSRLRLVDGRLLVSTPSLYWPCQGFYDDAHLYGRNAGGAGNWAYEAALTTRNTGAASYFGKELAMGGLVGVSSGDGLHLYEQDDAAWSEVAVVPAGALGGWIASTHLAGERLFVGNWSFATGSHGQVRVFDRDQGGANAWGARRSLFPSDSTPGAEFGARMAGNANRLAVVAPGTETVYVFETPPLERGTLRRAPLPVPR